MMSKIPERPYMPRVPIPRTAAQHLGHGLVHGYPLCCTLRWVWGWMRGARQQAWDRGSVAMRDGSDNRYVVCGIFHKREGFIDMVRRTA